LPVVELGDWYTASPFIVTSVDGMEAVYPPEQGVDLKAAYPGPGETTIKWKQHKNIDATPDGHGAGSKDPSVSYLYRTLDARQSGTVPVAFACTERWALWLNGQRVAMAPAIDKAPAPELILELPLKQGKNDLLIKVATRKNSGSFGYCFKSPAALHREAEDRVLVELSRDFPLPDVQKILAERQASDDYDLLVQQIADREHWRKVTPLVLRLDSAVWETDRDPLDVALRRTRKLFDSLARTPAGPTLAALAQELAVISACEPSFPVDDIVGRRSLYLEVHRLSRAAAVKDPRLDFDSILFAKSAPSILPHMSDQFYGWWSRPGGGIFILEAFKTDAPRLRCLTADMPDGSFIRPELSPDGNRVLFAYARYYPHVAQIKDKRTKTNLPEDAFYHVFEMNLDGTHRRRLTRGRYDDFSARYLPSGDIAFLSTRKGVFLQVCRENTARTLTEDLPDSYVRCGGNDFRPVPVFTLHAMDSAGGNLRPLSAFENFEYTPALANDGRILYTRWDYIDRFNGDFFSLWSCNPDGTNAQLVYGNYTHKPQSVCDAVPIPGTTRLAFLAAAHHSVLGGSLVLFDRALGTEGDGPIKRLTPEVPFPETEKNISAYYATPFPLSEDLYLVAWADHQLPPHSARLVKKGWPVAGPDDNPVSPMGLYLYDTFGNRSLIYRDPAIASASPIPVRPRPMPPAPADNLALDSRHGTFLVQDIYAGMDKIARGSVKRLRIVGVPPKVQPDMNKPNIGPSAEDAGKYVLGTVPVEEDGSACFEVPSGVPVFFQALDKNGVAIQTMRSLAYVAGHQTLSCVGCHESRDTAPPAGAGRITLAARRAPSRPALDIPGTWPLSYAALVQPLLDKQCVSCHKPGGGDKSQKLDLTPANSYDALLDYADKDLRKLAMERDRSVPGECPAAKSKLLTFLRAPHASGKAPKLDPESEYRFVAWMDLYATKQGSFSDDQAKELERFKQRWLNSSPASAPPPISLETDHGQHP
ncbi:MAG: hypothetical protein ACHRHE_16615, partial [Tepidisphaerales bacterium]